MTQPPSWTPGHPGGVERAEQPRSGPSGPEPQPSTRREAGHRRPARRRRPLRRLLLGLGLVLLLAVGTVGAYGAWLAHTFDTRHRTEAVDALAPRDGGPVDILLLGSDSRAAEGVADMGERSDTMMLVHIPEDRSAVYVASILRDSWVDIPGHGPGKVNSAIERGGHTLAVRTVEDLLGVSVNHLVVADFQGFRSVTDVLGGVPVCNPTAFSSGQRNPSFFPRGPVLLEGTAALRYVRERKAFGDGDVSRVQNQQRYVLGAVDRFLSPDVLLDPGRTQEVVGTFAEHLTTDPGLDSAAIASLAWQLRDIRGADVHMFTVPRAGFGYSDTGEAIVQLDEAAVADLRDALRADDVAAYLRAHEDAGSRPSAAAAPAAPGPAPVLTLLPPSPAAPTGALGEDPCGR
ncbi:LCP family protein [Micrococcus sp.]|uniref:LCP family protein n=1 Tax=Micrococcus sp. TaxID=1271 RepID=UPI002A91BA9A|nr:LCP family protein [Micrococcus sp.]MDY6055655.1 LCP family protein [Micrococcus sp.]